MPTTRDDCIDDERQRFEDRLARVPIPPLWESGLNPVCRRRLLTPFVLIIGLLLSPVHQAMACAMEAVESGGDDLVHAVDPSAGAESSGVDDGASPDGHDSCVCACTPALATERLIHRPAGTHSAGETGRCLLEPPLFRQLRPPRPASV